MLYGIVLHILFRRAFLVSKEDRVYIFEKDGHTAKFDAKHARAFHFKDYLCKDMNKLFHDF